MDLTGLHSPRYILSFLTIKMPEDAPLSNSIEMSDREATQGCHPWDDTGFHSLLNRLWLVNWGKRSHTDPIRLLE